MASARTVSVCCGASSCDAYFLPAKTQKVAATMNASASTQAVRVFGSAIGVPSRSKLYSGHLDYRPPCWLQQHFNPAETAAGERAAGQAKWRRPASTGAPS